VIDGNRNDRYDGFDMLTYTYDISLVGAAVCISLLAAFTGLTLTKGISAYGHAQRKAFVAMAAIALGGGIWSTHFVAMLAVRMPVEIAYDPLMTLASALIAILLVGMALLLMHFGNRNKRTIVIAGVLVGSGIVTMHYVGMIGIRGCLPFFENHGRVISTLVAFAMGIAAIAISYGRRSQGSILAGTAVFGLSVVFTHFSAMFWTGFALLSNDDVITSTLDNSELAMIVTFAAFVICGAFLLTASTFSFEPAKGIEQDRAQEVAGNVLPPPLPVPPAHTAKIAENGTQHPVKRLKSVSVPFEANHKIHFISYEEISAVPAEGHYTMLYARGEKLFCPWSITVSQANLPTSHFLRAHRSYLVNIKKISAFERRKDIGVCVLKDEAIECVPVSRSKMNDVRSALGI